MYYFVEFMLRGKLLTEILSLQGEYLTWHCHLSVGCPWYVAAANFSSVCFIVVAKNHIHVFLVAYGRLLPSRQDHGWA